MKRAFYLCIFLIFKDIPNERKNFGAKLNRPTKDKKLISR